MCMCKQLVPKQVGANVQLYIVVAFLPTSAAISKSCLYACLLYVYYKYIPYMYVCVRVYIFSLTVLLELLSCL